MTAGGKKLADDASQRSVENHGRITEAIAEACAGLRQAGFETSIRADHNYQLSNRAAFAWKLAALGIPTVLVYLGFTGDEGIRDAGGPFKDHGHWESAFGAYAYSTVPIRAFESRINCGSAPTWFLIRSRNVIEISPRG